tara:strand:+ start:3415 stop:4914 length:1500 start_codon:yes stop_codon:yes gene_type:complete
VKVKVKDKNDFKSILKDTTIIGASQVIVILILIIKSKITAILIGPIGLGLIYSLTNVTGLIGTISNFGFGTIAIKNISKVHSFKNNYLLSRIVKTYWRLAFITGSLGLFLVVIFSKYLSKIAFDNSNYTITFIIISCTLLLAQINTGQFVILQSLKYFKKYAISNIISGALIALFSIIIFYYYGISGVAATIIISSLIPPLINLYYVKHIKFQKVDITSKRIVKYGKELLNLGTSISLTRLMPIISTLVLNAFIVRAGGLDEVGLYNAGFVIIFGYTGIIFQAMEPEYFSRLSAHSNKKGIFNFTVNQQIEIAILLIAPMVMIFLFFASECILFLYSREFLILSDMVKLGMLGLFFKAFIWPLSYVLLVKKNSKLYFLNEFIFNLVFLGLSLLFYNNYGIVGLGYSFLIATIFNMIFIIFVLKYNYNFNIEKDKIKIFCIHSLLLGFAFIIILFDANKYFLYLSVPFIFTSVSLSYYFLNKKINIREYVINKIPFFNIK